MWFKKTFVLQAGLVTRGQTVYSWRRMHNKKFCKCVIYCKGLITPLKNKIDPFGFLHIFAKGISERIRVKQSNRFKDVQLIDSKNQ